LLFFQDYPHADYYELADSAVDHVRRTSPARPVYFTHIVRRVSELYELTPVKRGEETLYKVGKKKQGENHREGTKSAKHM
jgi:hypothetical protein